MGHIKHRKTEENEAIEPVKRSKKEEKRIHKKDRNDDDDSSWEADDMDRLPARKRF